MLLLLKAKVPLFSIRRRPHGAPTLNRKMLFLLTKNLVPVTVALRLGTRPNALKADIVFWTALQRLSPSRLRRNSSSSFERFSRLVPLCMM